METGGTRPLAGVPAYAAECYSVPMFGALQLFFPAVTLQSRLGDNCWA